MPAPVLATKLYIPPPRSDIVRRSRLIDRLNLGLSRTPRVTLISAPAGFGKTTLVSEWIASLTPNPSPIGRGEIAWLSLDEGDSDLARFLLYFVSAVQAIAPKCGENVLNMLQPIQPTDVVLTTLLNELAAIPERFILVLDDYHTLDCNLIDEALAFLIEHLPPHMQLVITTREDPQLPLARLRARGQLTELRAADLRFTPDEAAEFLNRVMGLNLSVKDVAALENRTEGWIAGLQLAAISMQGRSDVARFIGSFTGSHRFVLDYLMEEVLRRQPERVRNFLLQTSVLDCLSGSLCNAVTDQTDGQALLETLERGNLFVIPLDDQRQWWRYHHLFAEVLQAHLKEAHADRVSEIHRRASVWYEQHDLPADAIRHALAAKDFDRAAGLIELAGPATEDGRIQSTTWLGWAKALPAELIRARPVLNVWYAYGLLGRGELEAAEARFKDAEHWLEPTATTTEMVVVDQAQFKLLPATVAIGRAYIAHAFGNIPDTVRYASRALELVPEDERRRRSQAAMMLGMTYWASGNLPAAERVFADYTLRLRAAGNLPDAISTSTVLAEIRLALGHLREAIETVEQCLQFVMDQGEPIPLDAADLHLELSELYLEQGNLGTAAQHLQRSSELGEKAELPVWRYRWCIAQARLKKTQGDLTGALDLLDEAERLFIRTPLPDVCPISALKARIWVAQGRLTEALEWAHARSLSVDGAPGYVHEFELITLARALIARYRSNQEDAAICDALKLLERLLKAAEAGRRLGSVIEILVLQALAHQAQGSLALALAPLERALSLAEPEDYVRIFVDEGESMRWLLEKQAHGEGHQPIGYAAKLLAAFVQPATILPSTVPQPQSTLIEPLSERELEVLQYIAEGLTNREIADRLYLSLFTVKAHARSIYDKLAAHSRTQAVAKARELGVLPPS